MLLGASRATPAGLCSRLTPAPGPPEAAVRMELRWRSRSPAAGCLVVLLLGCWRLDEAAAAVSVGRPLDSPQALGGSFGVPLKVPRCGRLTGTRLGGGLRYWGSRVREVGGQRRPDAPLRQGWVRPEGPGVLLRWCWAPLVGERRERRRRRRALCCLWGAHPAFPHRPGGRRHRLLGQVLPRDLLLARDGARNGLLLQRASAPICFLQSTARGDNFSEAYVEEKMSSGF